MQYAESSQFFSLFKRFNFSPENNQLITKQYCCLQYQDFTQEQRRRAIPFPKYLVIERALDKYLSQQEFYIRLHEKARLDHDDPNSLAIVHLQGRHEDDKGEELKVDAKTYMHEKVTGL